jgi:hypothetical protein
MPTLGFQPRPMRYTPAPVFDVLRSTILCMPWAGSVSFKGPTSPIGSGTVNEITFEQRGFYSGRRQRYKGNP